MNKKGFTLVELLATLVILALVAGISIVAIFGNLEKAKEKTEKEFLNQLSNAVDTYINLCLSGMEQNTEHCKYVVNDYNGSELGKIIKRNGRTVTIHRSNYEASNYFRYVINEAILTEKDFINPVNSGNCKLNALLRFYRDDDYVYYYKIKLPEGCIKYNSNIISTIPDCNEGCTEEW